MQRDLGQRRQSSITATIRSRSASASKRREASKEPFDPYSYASSIVSKHRAPASRLPPAPPDAAAAESRISLSQLAFDSTTVLVGTPERAGARSPSLQALAPEALTISDDPYELAALLNVRLYTA